MSTPNGTPVFSTEKVVLFEVGKPSDFRHWGFSKIFHMCFFEPDFETLPDPEVNQFDVQFMFGIQDSQVNFVSHIHFVKWQSAGACKPVIKTLSTFFESVIIYMYIYLVADSGR